MIIGSLKAETNSGVGLPGGGPGSASTKCTSVSVQDAARHAVSQVPILKAQHAQLSRLGSPADNQTRAQPVERLQASASWRPRVGAKRSAERSECEGRSRGWAVRVAGGVLVRSPFYAGFSLAFEPDTQARNLCPQDKVGPRKRSVQMPVRAMRGCKP